MAKTKRKKSEYTKGGYRMTYKTIGEYRVYTQKDSLDKAYIVYSVYEKATKEHTNLKRDGNEYWGQIDDDLKAYRLIFEAYPHLHKAKCVLKCLGCVYEFVGDPK